MLAVSVRKSPAGHTEKSESQPAVPAEGGGGVRNHWPGAPDNGAI